jgi:hypothetical protein
MMPDGSTHPRSMPARLERKKLVLSKSEVAAVVDPSDRITLYVMAPPFGPGKSALVELRAELLPAIPRRELDRLIFTMLDPLGSNRYWRSLA